MACNCITGRAYEDANGNCLCDDGTGTPKDGCDGVLINGICTGGVRPPVISNEPLPPISGQLDIFGTKPPKPLIACRGMYAPAGYKYILNANNVCVLTVDYDSNTATYTPNNAGLANVLGTAGNSVSDLIANHKGIIGLGVALIAGYFAFGKNGQGHATEHTTINRKY